MLIACRTTTRFVGSRRSLCLKQAQRSVHRATLGTSSPRWNHWRGGWLGVAGLGTSAVAAYQYANPLALDAPASPPLERDDFEWMRQASQCVVQGNLVALQHLVRTRRSSSGKSTIPGSPSYTLLHLAVYHNRPEMVQWLLEQGADPNLQTTAVNGRMWKQMAARDFQDGVLLRYFGFGLTPLHLAFLADSVDVAERLLQHPSINLEAQTAAGHTLEACLNDNSDPRLAPMLRQAKLRQQEQRRQREKEQRRKFPLEQRLRQVIVGQDAPIDAVASAIRRKENGWHDSDRPLVFLFLGSSGIGKTELAKQVAHYLHQDNPDAFVRVDMSEFQEKHEVAKFIGSPPGYVGYTEGGQLTEKLKKCPQAVVLLDEVEKAHIDVLTIMLQVFDEGRLTDGQGNTVDCRDAIFVMTSNLAQEEIASEAPLLRQDNLPETDPDSLQSKFLRSAIYPILRDHFRRDEFLGRINEILLFLPFTDAELQQIVEKELRKWQAKAKATHHMSIQWTPEVAQLLSRSYNVRYGARSIKNEVERKVVNELARAHELDQIGPGAELKFIVDRHGQIRMEIEKPNGGTQLEGSAGGFFRSLWKSSGKSSTSTAEDGDTLAPST